jgi:DNA-binding LytR/AlgR family response regulator
MRCLIIDDEPASRKILINYISDTEELTLIGECKDALEARILLKETKADLLFLDINMPRLSGIDFIKTLKEPPAVIFTTAYSEFALDGFELDAVDYLLKPFSFERFLKAVEKASRVLQSDPTEDSYISVKSDGKLYRINFDEIHFAESAGDYVTLHTNDHKITFYATLKDFNEQLPSHLFCRIHRTYVVAIKRINFIEGNLVHLGNHKLPIGKSYKENFMNKYLS